MEIVFIRHGQTDVNKENRLQGSSIDLPLNAKGRAYAEKAAAKFDARSFDQVYSSPMKRAVETARIFTKGEKRIKLDKRLLEFDFGEWDGKQMKEIWAHYPDVLDPWGKVNKHYLKYAAHGESYAALEKRCASFINDLLARYPDQKILVVAHGRLIRMMAAHLLTNGDMDQIDTMDNCALAKFGLRQQQVRLFYYNRLLV